MNFDFVLKILPIHHKNDLKIWIMRNDFKAIKILFATANYLFSWKFHPHSIDPRCCWFELNPAKSNYRIKNEAYPCNERLLSLDLSLAITNYEFELKRYARLFMCNDLLVAHDKQETTSSWDFERRQCNEILRDDQKNLSFN